MKEATCSIYMQQYTACDRCIIIAVYRSQSGCIFIQLIGVCPKVRVVIVQMLQLAANGRFEPNAPSHTQPLCNLCFSNMNMLLLSSRLDTTDTMPPYAVERCSYAQMHLCRRCTQSSIHVPLGSKCRVHVVSCARHLFRNAADTIGSIADVVVVHSRDASVIAADAARIARSVASRKTRRGRKIKSREGARPSQCMAKLPSA